MQNFNTFNARIAYITLLIGAFSVAIHASDVVKTVNDVVSEVRENVETPSEVDASETADTPVQSSFPTQSCRNDLKKTLGTCGDDKKCSDTAWSKFRGCVHDTLKNQNPKNTDAIIKEAETVFLRADSMADCFTATEIRQKCGTDSLCRQKIFDGFNNCAKRFMADDDAPVIDLDAEANKSTKTTPAPHKTARNFSRSDLRKIKLKAEIDALEAENKYLETELESFKTDIEQAKVTYTRHRLLKEHKEYLTSLNSLQKSHDLQSLREGTQKLLNKATLKTREMQAIQAFEKMNDAIDGRLAIIRLRDEANTAYQKWLATYKEKRPEISQNIRGISEQARLVMAHIGELKNRKNAFENIQRMMQDTIGYIMGVKSAVDLSTDLAMKRTSFLTDVPNVSKDLESLATQEQKANEKYATYQSNARKAIQGSEIKKELPEVVSALAEIQNKIKLLTGHKEMLAAKKSAYDKVIADVKSLRNNAKGAADEAITHTDTTQDTDLTHVGGSITKIEGFISDANNAYTTWKSAHENFVIASIDAEIKAMAVDLKRTNDHRSRLEIGRTLNTNLVDLKALVETASKQTTYPAAQAKADQISSTIMAMHNTLNAWKTANPGIQTPDADKLLVDAEKARVPANTVLFKLKISFDIKSMQPTAQALADAIAKLTEPEDAEAKLKELKTLSTKAKETYETWKKTRALTEPNVEKILTEIDAIYTRAEDHYENIDLIDDVEEFKKQLIQLDADTRSKKTTVSDITPSVIQMRTLLKTAEEVNTKWKSIHSRDLAPVTKHLADMKSALETSEKHLAYYTTIESVETLEKEAQALTSTALKSEDHDKVNTLKVQVVSKQTEAKKHNDTHAQKHGKAPGKAVEALAKFGLYISKLDEQINRLSLVLAAKEANKKVAELYKGMGADQLGFIQTNDVPQMENFYKAAKQKRQEMEKIRQEHLKKWGQDLFYSNRPAFQDGQAKVTWLAANLRQKAQKACQAEYSKTVSSCEKKTSFRFGHYNRKQTDQNCMNRVRTQLSQCFARANAMGR